MKKTSKALLLSLCAVLLVVASVMGTLAYLTSTDTVTNTFTVGNVVITLDEAPVDANGAATTGDRVKANTYKLMPGHAYDKDPTVHVTATSEPCYVFIKVEGDLSTVEATARTADEENGVTEYVQVATQITNNGWTALDTTNNPGVYYYKKDNTDIYKPTTGETADNDLEIFDGFEISSTATNDALSKYVGDGTTDKTLKITAYAIQADGFDSAADAWAAGKFGDTTN